MADQDFEPQNAGEESVKAIVNLTNILHEKGVIGDEDLKDVLGNFSGGDEVAEKYLDDQ